MDRYIATIKKRIAEEVTIKRGRPKKDLTPQQISSRRKQQQDKRKRERPMTVTEPWRCKQCGHLIYFEMCLSCQTNKNKRTANT